jgi:hypothetical protein
VFHGLTEDQLEELGGIEFRALNMLMWAVPLVCYCTVAGCTGPSLNFLLVLFFLVGDPLCCGCPVYFGVSLEGQFLDTHST